MAIEPPPSYTAPPADLPIRGDRATFSNRVDAWVTWFSTVILVQLAAMIANAYNNALEAFNWATQAIAAAAAAAASAAAATAITNAPMWVAGTYGDGDAVWDPLDHVTYRSIGAGVRNTNPSLDQPHWAIQISSIGLGGQLITGSIALTSTAAGCISVTPSQPGLFAIMPDATSCSKAAVLRSIYNAGDVDYGLRDFAGNKIGWIPPKTNVVMGLADNATPAGVWALASASKTGTTAIFETTGALADTAPIQRIAIDSDRTVFIFGFYYAVVYEESTNSWGAPVLIRATSFCSVILSGANQLLAVTCNTGTALEAVTITISGTALTVNSANKATGVAPATINSMSQMVAVGAAWCVGFHSNTAPSSYIRGISISGITPAFGAAQPVLSNNSVVSPLLFVSGAVVRAVHLAASGSLLYCEPFTFTGSTPAVGTVVSTAASGGSSLAYLRAFMNGNGNIVAQYQNNSARMAAAVFKLTGTVEAVSAVQLSLSAAIPQSQGDFVAISGNKTLFACLNSGGTGINFNVHTDTAGVGSAGTELALGSFNATKIAALALAGSTARIGAQGSTDVFQFEIDCSGASPVLAGMQTADLAVGMPQAPSDSLGVRNYTLLTGGASAYTIGSRSANEAVFAPTAIRARPTSNHDTFATGVAGANASESWTVGNNHFQVTTIKRIEACA